MYPIPIRQIVTLSMSIVPEILSPLTPPHSVAEHLIQIDSEGLSDLTHIHFKSWLGTHPTPHWLSLYCPDGAKVGHD